MPLPEGGFFRRPLPPPAIGFSSPEGVAIFKGALHQGGAECYFALAETFRTQDEPAYCGLGTLVTALNALAVDPGRRWKGPWRWFHEDMLSCCKPLEQIREDGMDLDEWACLARCNNAAVRLCRASDSSGEGGFRREVERCCSAPNAGGGVLVVSYSRKQFGQAGDGHYSPIGAYNAELDLVLILDVARFKHPPHWVPLTELFAAMQRTDPSTGQCRGYATLRRDSTVGGTLFVLNRTFGTWHDLDRYFRSTLPDELEREGFTGTPAQYAWRAIFLLPSGIAAMVSTNADQFMAGHALDPDRVAGACAALAEIPSTVACGAGCDGACEYSQIVRELQSTALFRQLQGELKGSHPLPMSAEGAAMLLLCLARSVDFPEPLRSVVAETLDALPQHPGLEAEVQGLQNLVALAVGEDGAWFSNGVDTMCCDVLCAEAENRD